MRRKLIEQVVKRYGLVTSISAAATSAHVSAAAGSNVIDRKGFLSAYFVQMHTTHSGSCTTDSTVFTLYQSDDKSTWTAVNTGTWTMQTYPAQSAGGTADTTAAQLIVNGQICKSLNVDLVGLKRYLQIYLTPTGETTLTAIVSVTCILGDAVIEPAV